MRTASLWPAAILSQMCMLCGNAKVLYCKHRIVLLFQCYGRLAWRCIRCSEYCHEDNSSAVATRMKTKVVAE